MVLKASSSRAGLMLLSVGCMVATATPHFALAQQERRGTPALDLPRPGFERHTSHVGPVEVRVEADVSALYDTNVYATSTKPQDDLIAIFRPRVEADYNSSTVSLHGEAYAEVREHLDIGRESSAEFGAALDGVLLPGRTHSLSTEIRYDRAIQSRADPEARAPITARPRKIDIFSGEVAYTATTKRLRFLLAPAFQTYNFLDPAESDRDMHSYRVRGRVTWQPSAPMAFYLEAYGNYRDFRLRTDFSGVNRDATTYGALVGMSREVSGRLRGEIGVGVFHFDPSDATLNAYTGFAANGQLIWSPRARTAVTLSVFRGDVATIQSGATGRTDTRLGLKIDQEVRHNLLLTGGVGWLSSDYRGSATQKDTLTAQLGAEYLLDRKFSLFANASYARRDASIPLDEYSRGRIELGIRLRY